MKKPSRITQPVSASRRRATLLGSALCLLAVAFFAGRALHGCSGEPARTEQPLAKPTASAPASSAPLPPSRPAAAPRRSELARTAPKDEVFHPRDPEEWQGMLVDVSERAQCGAPDGCGLALACVRGHCGPCESDEDCAIGEVCVMDHCLLRNNVTCRTRHDCPNSEHCIVTDSASPGPRYNAGLKSECASALKERLRVPRPAPTLMPTNTPELQPYISSHDMLELVRDAGSAEMSTKREKRE